MHFVFEFKSRVGLKGVAKSLKLKTTEKDQKQNNEKKDTKTKKY